MPAQSKIDMVQKINESLDASKGLFVVDYRGLTVKESQALRRSVREAGGDMKVYKNNLMKIALNDAQMPAIDDILVGTCAYVFYENDPVEVAKALKNAAKDLGKLEILGGIADGVALDAAAAKAYADLPSREELLAQLVYVVASPLRGIASVCAGPARGLATALSQLAEQKEGGQAAA